MAKTSAELFFEVRPLPLRTMARLAGTQKETGSLNDCTFLCKSFREHEVKSDSQHEITLVKSNFLKFLVLPNNDVKMLSSM